MDDQLIAWAAGFFDGEGCVRVERIHNSYRKPFYRLRVSLSQKKVEPLLAIKQAWGGTIFRHKTGVHELILMSARAANFLSTVRPYLLVKGAVADHGIAFAGTMSRHYAGRGGKGVPEHVMAERERLQQCIHRVNSPLTN